MASSNFSRRRFLKGLGLGSVSLAGFEWAGLVSADLAPGSVDKISEHLCVYLGPINVGIIRHRDEALLIDCGDGSVADCLAELGIESIDRMIFTHHHRDQACGAFELSSSGAKIGVPEAERAWFDEVESYWSDPKSRWHIYSFHPHHLMLAESVRVDATYRPGDKFVWGPAKIEVIGTPGHTDGSVSYRVAVDGRVVIFSGDLIYDEGQVWEIYSLQKGFRRGSRQVRDYHGFLGAKDELIESLERIKAAEAELLVPSHGRVMNDPSGAVDAMVDQLERCYEK